MAVGKPVIKSLFSADCVHLMSFRAVKKMIEF